MKTFLIGIACLLLNACATLAEPQSLDQRLAYAYASNTAIRTAARKGLDTGTLTVTDGQYVLQITDQSRGLLDAAHVALNISDTKTAEGRLLLVLSIFDQLERYLADKRITP